MEVVVTTGAISRARLQSNDHHQQTNIQVFYRPDALPVAQPTVSKHWRENFWNISQHIILTEGLEQGIHLHQLLVAAVFPPLSVHPRWQPPWPAPHWDHQKHESQTISSAVHSVVLLCVRTKCTTFTGMHRQSQSATSMQSKWGIHKSTDIACVTDIT